MADTNFVSGTVVEADWLQDVNDSVYPGVPSPGTLRAEVFGRTAGEIAAGVTPTNYAYAPGDVRRYGAVVDGVANDHVALVNALAANAGGTVTIPTTDGGVLLGTSTISVPADTGILGLSRHKTKIVHGFSGDLFDLGDGARLENLWLVGQGATYTGRAIVYTGTNGRQLVRGVRASDWDGAVQDFAVSAGSQSTTDDCRFSRRNAGTGTGRYAVVISSTQQLSAVPRKFSNFETDGQCAFDFGGCNDTFVDNAFVGDLNFTADSRGVLMSNIRWANQAACTLNGHNIVISGDIAPQLTIASGADAINLMGGTFNNLPVIDGSGNGRNLIAHWAVAYTPTLTSGGAAPSLGNGALVASAARSGGIVFVEWQLTIGSTTTLGTGDLQIGLPSWAPNVHARNQVTGAANYNPSGAGAGFYLGSHVIGAGLQYASLRRDTTNSVTGTAPGTAAAGNVYAGSFSYIVG